MNHSIIIPTKNRPLFINRILHYYQLVGYNGQILIGDSSDTNELFELKQIIEKYSTKLNIYFLHEKSKSADEITVDLLNKIEKEFVSFLPDDDIILIDGINHCINFLIQNMDYVAANGKSYYFTLDEMSEKHNGKIGYIYKYKMYYDESFDSRTRISNYFKNTDCLLMSVFRTKVFKECFSFSYLLPRYHRIFIYGELIPGIITLSKGKVKHLDVDYLIRQGHDNNLWSKLDWYKFIFECNCQESNKIIKSLFSSFNLFDDFESEKILRRYFQDIIRFTFLKNSRLKYLEKYLGKMIATVVFHNVYKRIHYLIFRYKNKKLISSIYFKKIIHSYE